MYNFRSPQHAGAVVREADGCGVFAAPDTSGYTGASHAEGDGDDICMARARHVLGAMCPEEIFGHDVSKWKTEFRSLLRALHPDKHQCRDAEALKCFEGAFVKTQAAYKSLHMRHQPRSWFSELKEDSKQGVSYVYDESTRELFRTYNETPGRADDDERRAEEGASRARADTSFLRRYATEEKCFVGKVSIVTLEQLSDAEGRLEEHEDAMRLVQEWRDLRGGEIAPGAETRSEFSRVIPPLKRVALSPSGRMLVWHLKSAAAQRAKLCSL